ncbi:MAG: class I SAM-dependent methyltransferase [Pseudomonadaceae bacterium]|nr:class I SAM-dependent methyltransferase [Pseudomonadaceae bacterium]
MSAEPDFGNWLRLHRVAALLSSGLLLTIATLAVPAPWNWVVASAGLTIFVTGLFLVFVYYQFHDRGGAMQRKLWRLTLEHLHGYRQLTGDALDIGTGNGSLAVLSAMENPDLRVIGIDLWAPQWEYSLDDCRRNAQRAGVTRRCTFQRASAHALPYLDETFDYVMSHFVFHEVQAAPNKRTVVEEALRVLRKGGYFSFHDMFFDARLYGDASALLEALRALGVERVQLVETRQLTAASPLLRSKRILGNCAIVWGKK